MITTLYWHDYETFGSDPRRDRPAQFAGLRTDEELNEIGEPLVIYCKPPRDLLPHPEACLLTGITPQMADERGVPEPEFIARIHAELAQPGSCGVGYNTLRFDDEVTRHTLYRNFYDPYAREWQNGNSRWDIIDLVRMCYALRPQGLEWPLLDGKPTFRLEELAAANGIEHGSAHDALSDVRATVSLARLVRRHQPRLYDWLFRLRDKRRAAAQLDLAARRPVLHTSRMYPAESGCTTLVMPLAQDPRNGNGVLVYDLRHDPEPFLELDVDRLKELLFTRSEDLPQGTARLPVKSVKLNKCPALAPRATLDAAAIQRIAIDPEACDRHWRVLESHPAFMQRVAQAYGGREFPPAADVELALYEGFFDDGDRLQMERVRGASPQELAALGSGFRDGRLPELLFRYRARNWPQTLSEGELQRWERLRGERIRHGAGGETLGLEEYRQRIAALRRERDGDPEAQRRLDRLEEWGEMLERGLLSAS
ncbi:MAG TPA: exodeoxyribonuclease I [Gammaproteobacteria bacterium]|nr:exodeoxyribonuclease I [Gammaproteobacteria bacterium]